MKYLNKYVIWSLVLIGLMLVGAACQSMFRLPEGLAETNEVTETASEAITVAEFTPALIDLEDDLSELKAAFNAHPDVPRLILLLSPT